MPRQSPLEQAQALLERLSLTGSEARTVLALMRLGAGTTIQLAPVTGIGRTNLYRELEALEDQRLVHKSPGRNAVWAVVGRDELLVRLLQREQEKLRGAEEAVGQLRAVLDQVPEPDQRRRGVIQVTDEVSQAFLYREAVSAAQSELLVFNRGPYVGEPIVDPLVVAALDRGVQGRALWQAHEVYGASKDAGRLAVAYAEAGVGTRVAEQLPLSMALIDRSFAMLGLPGDGPSELPYVASETVHNRAFAEAMVTLYEQHWDRAEPLNPSGVTDLGVQATGPSAPASSRANGGPINKAQDEPISLEPGSISSQPEPVRRQQ